MPKLKLNVGKYDNNSFSTNLRVILREKGITVEKLGDDIGLSSSILYDYLNGRRRLVQENVELIAKYLNVEIAELMSHSKRMEAEIIDFGSKLNGKDLSLNEVIKYSSMAWQIIPDNEKKRIISQRNSDMSFFAYLCEAPDYRNIVNFSAIFFLFVFLICPDDTSKILAATAMTFAGYVIGLKLEKNGLFFQKFFLLSSIVFFVIFLVCSTQAMIA